MSRRLAARGLGGSILALLLAVALPGAEAPPRGVVPPKPATAEQLEEYLRKLFATRPATPLEAAEGIGEIVGATADLAKLRPRSPMVAVARLRLGEVFLAMGNYDTARFQYTEFLRFFPNSPQAYEAHLYLGETLYRMGRYAEAAERLTEGIRLEPTPYVRAGGRYLLVLTYAKLGNSSAAQAALDLLRRENPVLARQAEMGLWRQENLAPGRPAPEVAGVDVLTGLPVRLRDLRGRPVLLVFWSMASPASQLRMRLWVAAGVRHEKAGLVVVGVCLDTDAAAVTQYARKRGLGWRVICDGKGALGPAPQAYRLPADPLWLVIDGDGKIVAANPEGEALDRAVLKALLPAAPQPQKPEAGPKEP